MFEKHSASQFPLVENNQPPLILLAPKIESFALKSNNKIVTLITRQNENKFHINYSLVSL